MPNKKQDVPATTAGTPPQMTANRHHNQKDFTPFDSLMQWGMSA